MTVVVGTQLQGGFGLWADGGVPTGYTYQWQSSANGTTGWANVVGETRSDYITLEADVGLYFRVAVTATNAGGSSTVVYSAPVGPVATAAATIPVLIVAPLVTGDAIEGETLSCSTGSWTNAPTSYGYLWQTSSGGVTWSSATTGSTLLLSGYDYLYIRCQVTASNAGGASAPAYSGVAGPVASAVVPSLDIYGIAVVDGVPILVRCHPN